MSVPQNVLDSVYGSVASDWRQHANGGGWVYKTAIVDDMVYLHPTSIVFGNAWISSNAREFFPIYVKGTWHSVTLCSYSRIAIGCLVHDISYWLEHYKAILCKEGYTPSQISEYGNIIRLIAGWAKNVLNKDEAEK